MHNLLTSLKDVGIVRECGKVNSNWRKIVTPELNAIIDLEIKRLGVDNISQLIWCLSNNQPRPKCKTCSKNTRFLSSRKFRTYCSAKCAALNDDTKVKRAESTLKIYGVTNVAKVSSIKHKQSTSARKAFTKKILQEIKGKFIPDTDVLNSADHFNFTCVKCGTTAPWRVFKGRIPRCYKCRPHCQSAIHVKVRHFLENLGVQFIEHDRKVIKPLELDFYLEDFQLAIEVNGIYWHSEENGHLKYGHQNKTLRCLEKGVTLIHLFENDIVLNFSQIQTKLRENYIEAKHCDIDFDGVLEVDGCWPLPQWFSASISEIGEPQLRVINRDFTKQKLHVWDSGMLFYTKNNYA